MNVVITQWALDSYLNLVGKIFTKQEYKVTIRPDVLLLKVYPQHTKFNLQQFWCIAEYPSGAKIQNGFKMKWDSLGSGKNELRLPITFVANEAYLCAAYQKLGSKEELRHLARFKTHQQLIRENKFTICERLS